METNQRSNLTLALTDPHVSDHSGCWRVAVWHAVDSRFVLTEDEPRALRRVYECHAMDWYASMPVDYVGERRDAAIQQLLEKAYETFNVGEDDVAADYRAHQLRSLSVGDAVVIDGEAWMVDRFGWVRVADDALAHVLARR